MGNEQSSSGADTAVGDHHRNSPILPDESLSDEQNNTVIDEVLPSSQSSDVDDREQTLIEEQNPQFAAEMAKTKNAIRKENQPNVRFLGWKQVGALFQKNLLTKYRTPLSTLTEVLSPVFMMLILVAAYTLSTITDKDARHYTTIKVDLPGPWLDIAQEAVNLMTWMGESNATEIVEEAVARRHLDSLVEVEEEEAMGGTFTGTSRAPFEFLSSLGWRNGVDTDHDWDEDFDEDAGTVSWDDIESTIRRQLQFATDDALIDDDDSNLSEEVEDGEADVFDILNSAYRQVRRLLSNPVTTPTFQQYVGLSLAISAAINANELPSVFSDSSFGRQWGNLLTLGTLHLAPASNPIVTEFWNYLRVENPILLSPIWGNSTLQIRIHDTEADGIKYINNNLDERAWALLDFSNWESTAEAEYKIRMNYTTLPNTAEIVNFVSIGLDRTYQRYYLSGYMTLQRTLNEFAMSRAGSCDDVDTNIYTMPMPTAAYSQNAFFQAVGYLLGLTIAMAYLYPASRTIKLMVEEKETRMKETLMILGVRPWAHWFSWVLSIGLMFFVIAVLVTMTLSGNVLLHSDPVYLFWFIGLFSSATVGFCFVIAAFFSRAKLASIVGPMALFATLLPRFIFFGTNRFEAVGGKMIASFLPCTAFAFGADIIADYEYSEVGVQSFNSGDGDYSFDTVLGFLFVDTIIYMFLGWYLELVIPRQYGVARPWYFLFLPSYWWSVMCCCFAAKPREDDQQDMDQTSYPEYGTTDHPDDFEDVPHSSFAPRVRIGGLTKKYTRRKDIPPAVNDLYLTLHESQITCLLGHNGAGKTTAISVLTGLYSPTAGDCVIYGNSIVKNTNAARQSMGICPQHNVLFDRLTVNEHLSLFQKIKGIRPNRDNTKEKAVEIGLGEYLQTTSIALSGGNKRKLSLAIALCGDPKFLLLDEPTSGMDPSSRRKCWELLRQKRAGRVILLTTHFMDEGELLADRVAVMKEGKLQCCGSTLFLKDRFGLGYNLTIVLNEDTKSDAVERPHDTSFADSNEISLFLTDRLPNTVLIRQTVRELTYRFPQGSEESFPNVFDDLENARDQLGIGAYGVSNSTLEEVFLQLAEREESVGKDKDLPEDDVTDEVGQQIDVVTQEDLQYINAIRQIGLLFHKRWLIQKRDIKGFFFMIVLPVLLCGLVLLVLTLDVVLAGPPIEMSADLYSSRSAGVTNALTDVLVGGGASSSETTPSVQIRAAEFAVDFNESYPNTNLSYAQSLVTSRALSEYLLSTYNNHDHNPRFGAIAMQDEVPMVLAVDWDSVDAFARSFSLGNSTNSSDVWGNITGQLEEFLSNMIFDQGPLDVFSLFNISFEAENISLNLTSNETVNLLVELTNFSRDDELIDATNLQNQTESALRSIFLSTIGFDTSSPSLIAQNLATAAAQFRSSLELRQSGEADFSLALYSLFEDISFAAFDGTSASNTTELLASLQLTSASIDSLVVEREMELLADALERSLVNANITVNSTVLTDTLWSVGAIYGTALNITGNSTGSNTTGTDDALIVFSLVALDGILDYGLDVSGNGTWTLEDIVEIIAAPGDYLFSLETPKASVHVNQDGASFEVDELYLSMFGDVLSNKTDASGGIGEFIIDFMAGAWSFQLRDINFKSEGELLGNETAFTASVDNILLRVHNSEGYLLLENVVSTSEGQQTMGIIDFSINITLVDFELVDGAGFIEFDTTAEMHGFVLYNETDRVDFNISSIIPEGQMDYNFTLNSTASVLHNSSSPHSVAAFHQAYSEFLFKSCLPESSGAYLKSVNHPLPLTTQQEVEIQTVLSILAGLFLLIPYCYIPAAFGVFGVKERVTKSKHLQLVSGVNLSAYWTASYLWDIVLWLILSILVMLIFLMYGTTSAAVYVGDVESFFCTFLLTFGYGLSALPFAYLLSRSFNNPSSAQIAVMGFFFVTGFVAVNAYFIMSSVETTEKIADGLLPWFRMWPAFNIGEGFIQLSSAFWEREILFGNSRPFDWDVCGRNLFLVYTLSIPYFLCLMALEYASDGGAGGVFGRWLRSVRASLQNMQLRWAGVKQEGQALLLDDGLDAANTHEDDDVIAERSRVEANESVLKTQASVLLVNLWKIYPPSIGLLSSCMTAVQSFFRTVCCFCQASREPHRDEDDDDERKSVLPKRAVRGVTTAVMQGETYGLLGVNGAGKTTALGVLTGDVAPTAGVATVCGYDVTGATAGGVQGARMQLGFCPQTDPLLDLMTGRETLRMFGKLRGIPEEKLDATVQALLEQLTLTPHADKVSESYSGGNKRKLSLGIALIGAPKVLLIDEASSGMDPAARRHTWELIESVRKRRSVILTTHLMEEAEALCTRVAIMVKGQLLCLGSVQHLKTKYLDGYTIDVQCEASASETAIDKIVVDILGDILPGSILSERHGRSLRFDIPSLSSLGLGETFRRLQDAKKRSAVENYSISQCSLEQVFIKLVNGEGDVLRKGFMSTDKKEEGSTNGTEDNISANATNDSQSEEMVDTNDEENQAT